MNLFPRLGEALMKVTSIDAIDQLEQRDPDAARSEGRECLDAIRPCMTSLGRAFSGVVAIGAIAAGEPHAVLVLVPSAQGTLHSVGAKAALRDLALICANLPHDLQDVFDAALVKEKARRLRQAARLAGGAEKRSE
jgi:hypothetical protein